MRLVSYCTQEAGWPNSGQHILAHTDNGAVIVYQAFSPEIAQFAVENNKFGGPHYSMTRMTWIKTNFLWMMYRSNWGRAKNQEKVLAIHVSKDGFEKILRRAYTGKSQNEEGLDKVDVRLQWDPDHDPNGKKKVRRAIQLGLRGETLEEFNNHWIVKIEDVSDIVQEGLKMVTANQLDLLKIPEENVYKIEDKEIIKQIDSDLWPSVGVSKSSLERKILLSLGGSFNPVHKNHIDIMVKTKEWLKKNTDFKDVSGILVVTTDDYLKHKFGINGEKILKAKHRLKLCQLACAPHSNWLSVHPVPCVSGYEAGLTNREMDNTLFVGMVKGADKYDKARRSHWRQQARNCVRVDVILGRGDVTGKMEADFQEDLQAGLVLNSNYFIIPENVGDISSTCVREVLDRLISEDSQHVQPELSMMMSPSSADYIFEQRKNLYLSLEDNEKHPEQN